MTTYEEIRVQDELGKRERAALLTLMAVARDAVPNSELKSRFGIDLSGELRRRLEKLGYIETTRVGRGFAYGLTDPGWKRCEAELGAERPAGSGPVGSALWAVLAGLGDYLGRAGLRAGDVFQPSVDLEARIRTAYAELPKAPGGWVALRDLRPELGAASKAEVDAVLERMNRLPDVALVSDSNVKALSAEDRAAAVRFGAETRDLLRIESR